jgi:outer membrane lipoprotein-sorting protein
VPSPPSRRRLAALLLLALLSLGLEVAHAAPASALPPALLTAATALGSHDTVRARFEQTKSSVLFVQDMVRTGTLELRRADGRLLWTYDDGPAFLMAGGRFYPAGKSAEEVGKDGAAGFSMPGAGDMSGVLQAVFTLDPEALAAHFSAKVTGPGVFELTPSGPAGRGMFSKVTLRVDGEPLAVRETAMDEPTGDRTVITFTDVAVDAPLPAERFMTPSERSAARTP